MASAQPTHPSQSLADIIAKQAAFHRRWKDVSMGFYAVASVGMIMCSSAAILFAALNRGLIAAVLSAVATVLASAEKSLLFREKWKLHLGVLTAYHNLEVEISAGIMTTDVALKQMRHIAESYASALPIETRIG